MNSNPKPLFLFQSGDKILIQKICATDNRLRLYESFGIFPGKIVQIFLVCGKKIILLVGKTKLAISPPASEEILGEKP